MHYLPITPRTGGTVLALLLATGVAATPAAADTIAFTLASTGTITPDAAGQVVVSDPAAASQSPDGSWGSATASASVNIAAGQMGGRTGVTYDEATSFVFSQFQAVIGDGFRTFDDNDAPFTWNGETTSFTLDVDGSIFAPAHINNLSAYVALILYSPGSVQPGMNYFGDAGRIGHYLFHIGNPTQRTFYSPDGTNQIELSPTAYLGNPTSGVHINQPVTPGGDFDWVLLMSSSVYLTEPGSLDVDLSHTVTLGYTGPAGATTRSVSGAFTNVANPTASVPEPGSTLALLSLATCALAGGRLRRRSTR